jgi:hypothetical protein
MNPALGLVMVVAGGALIAVAALGYVLGWFAMGVAIAVGVLGLVVDTAGALLFVAARRGDRARH